MDKPEVFSDLKQEVENIHQGGEEDIGGPTEIPSFCVNCEGEGLTRLLLTRIPFFKEVIVVAFTCDNCGYRNNEVQFGGRFGDKGCREELRVLNKKDLNREVIKADSAVVSIPDLDFEIPAHTQKGCLNTIEGILQKSIDDLSADQPVRRHIAPEVAAKIDQFIEAMTAMKEGEREFTIAIDDPAGNSHIQNYLAPVDDPQLKISFYERTHEQDAELGLAADYPTEEQSVTAGENGKGPAGRTVATVGQIKLDEYAPQEVYRFPETCSGCQQAGEARMICTDIPHFKQIVLMSFLCDNCGYKTTEVKAGGAIAPKGKKITFKFTCPEDLTRDVLKAETACLIIPELDLELTSGTLGGMFTTVEGLLTQIEEKLTEANPFQIGDSSTAEDRVKFTGFLSKIKEFRTGNSQFTLILDDPVSNSYLQNLFAPDPDPNLTEEEYERTEEQNDELGITDMKTEGYEEEEQQAAGSSGEASSA